MRTCDMSVCWAMITACCSGLLALCVISRSSASCDSLAQQGQEGEENPHHPADEAVSHLTQVLLGHKLRPVGHDCGPRVSAAAGAPACNEPTADWRRAAPVPRWWLARRSRIREFAALLAFSGLFGRCHGAVGTHCWPRCGPRPIQAILGPDPEPPRRAMCEIHSGKIGTVLLRSLRSLASSGGSPRGIDPKGIILCSTVYKTLPAPLDYLIHCHRTDGEHGGQLALRVISQAVQAADLPVPHAGALPPGGR